MNIGWSDQSGCAEYNVENEHSSFGVFNMVLQEASGLVECQCIVPGIWIGGYEELNIEWQDPLVQAKHDGIVLL